MVLCMLLLDSFSCWFCKGHHHQHLSLGEFLVNILGESISKGSQRKSLCCVVNAIDKLYPVSIPLFPGESSRSKTETLFHEHQEGMNWVSLTGHRYVTSILKLVLGLEDPKLKRKSSWKENVGNRSSENMLLERQTSSTTKRPTCNKLY